jgi:hypothetical protein
MVFAGLEYEYNLTVITYVYGILGYLFYELFGDVTMGLNFITTTDVLLGYLIILDTSSLQIVFDFLSGLDAPGCCWLGSILNFHREIVKEIAGAELGSELAGRLSLIRLSLLLLGCRLASMSEAKSAEGGSCCQSCWSPFQECASAHPANQINIQGDTNEQGAKEKEMTEFIHLHIHPATAVAVAQEYKTSRATNTNKRRNNAAATKRII